MISIFNKEKSKWHLGDSTGHIIKLHNNFFIPITREGRAECVQTSCACKCPQPHFQSLISAALKYTPLCHQTAELFSQRQWERFRLTSEAWITSRKPQLWGLLKPWDTARSRICCCLALFLELSSLLPSTQLSDVADLCLTWPQQGFHILRYSKATSLSLYTLICSLARSASRWAHTTRGCHTPPEATPRRQAASGMTSVLAKRKAEPLNRVCPGFFL